MQDAMGAAPAPEQGAGDGQKVAEAFPKVLQVMTGLADAVPPEMAEEYQAIVGQFAEFVQKFTGGAQEGPGGMAPVQQGAGPQMAPVR